MFLAGALDRHNVRVVLDIRTLHDPCGSLGTEQRKARRSLGALLNRTAFNCLARLCTRNDAKSRLSEFYQDRLRTAQGKPVTFQRVFRDACRMTQGFAGMSLLVMIIAATVAPMLLLYAPASVSTVSTFLSEIKVGLGCRLPFAYSSRKMQMLRS